MSSIIVEKILPPLRDGQQATPVWLCTLCGEEQYRWDWPALYRGRPVCVRCLERMREEEE